MGNMGERQANGTVLVTGGNRGIGRAISLELARTGYDIIFTYNSGSKEAKETEQAIRETGVSASSYHVDLSSRQNLENFSDIIRKEGIRLFALVNNAGIYRGSKLDEIDNDEWDKIIGLNMSAPFLLTRNLHSQLVDGGSIVNISSVYGFRADPWAHGYQASKAALIHLTKGIAKELAPRLRVNCVAPGYVRTDINRGGWENEAFNKKITKMTPMSRWGEPEDVANSVRFLIDPVNSFITGHTLVVDGGIGL
jgi:3-oxoacyl-[acyl-carrier protein] reductase